MLRLLARGVLVVGIVVALLGGAIALALVPPAPLALPEPGAVLSGVTVVRPGFGRLEGQRVTVEADRIVSIVPDREPEGRFVGAFVLPGLIDLHGHFPPELPLGNGDYFPFLYLYHGVTTVRSAGDIDGTSTPPVRSGVEDGAFPGPRVFGCGPFVDGPSARWANSRVLLDPGAAEALVGEIAERHDCIKAYDTLSPDVSAALLEAARAKGLPVIGHVPQGSTFAEAHLDEVQHMMGMASAEGEAGAFPRSLLAWRGLSDAELDAIVSAAVTQRKALTPTLVVIDRLAHSDDPALADAPDVRALPRFYPHAVWRRPAFDAEEYVALREALSVMQKLLVRLHRAGARLHLGSDSLAYFSVPGGGVHRELALYVEAGLSPEQALEIATRANGRALPLSGLGRVGTGTPADLLVFAEDPTRDLAALATLEAVVAQGRLYLRSELDDQLDRYVGHARGAVFDAVSMELARRALSSVSEPGAHPH